MPELNPINSDVESSGPDSDAVSDASAKPNSDDVLTGKVDDATSIGGKAGSKTDLVQSAIPAQPEVDLLKRQDEVIAGLDDLDEKVLQAIEALAAERKQELELHQQQLALEEKSQRENILNADDFKESQKDDQRADDQRKAA